MSRAGTSVGDAGGVERTSGGRAGCETCKREEGRRDDSDANMKETLRHQSGFMQQVISK